MTDQQIYQALQNWIHRKEIKNEEKSRLARSNITGSLESKPTWDTYTGAHDSWDAMGNKAPTMRSGLRDDILKRLKERQLQKYEEKHSWISPESVEAYLKMKKEE